MDTGRPSWWTDAVNALSQDELLGKIVDSYPNESLVGRGDLFSTLVRSIVGQQISVLAADAVWGRLINMVKEITNHPEIKKLNLDLDLNSSISVCYILASVLPLRPQEKQTILEFENNRDKLDYLKALIKRLGG